MGIVARLQIIVTELDELEQENRRLEAENKVLIEKVRGFQQTRQPEKKVPREMYLATEALQSGWCSSGLQNFRNQWGPGRAMTWQVVLAIMKDGWDGYMAAIALGVGADAGDWDRLKTIIYGDYRACSYSILATKWLDFVRTDDRAAQYWKDQR